MLLRVVRAAGVASLISGLLLVAAGTVVAKGNAVTIVDYAFQPKTITIAVGDSVTWNNTGDDPHTATADAGSFDAGRISPGASASHTFAQAGTFAYHCEIHPIMKGTIVVQAAAAPTAAGGATNPPTDSLDPLGSTGGGVSSVLLLVGLGLVSFAGLALLRRPARR